MKKIFNKLSIIILLIFGIFLVSGCEENGDNPLIMEEITKRRNNSSNRNQTSDYR